MDVVKLPDACGVPQEKLRRLAAHVFGLPVGAPARWDESVTPHQKMPSRCTAPTHQPAHSIIAMYPHLVTVIFSCLTC